MVNEEDEGARIRFVGGSYVGLWGWINKSRQQPLTRVNVIVEADPSVNPKIKREKATQVNQESFILASEEGAPITYVEAMFDQHPDMDQLLRKLCTGMAKCGLDPNDSESAQSLTAIVLQRLQKAQLTQHKKSTQKACWQHVEWATEPEVCTSSSNNADNPK